MVNASINDILYTYCRDEPEESVNSPIQSDFSGAFPAGGEAVKRPSPDSNNECHKPRHQSPNSAVNTVAIHEPLVF